MRSSRKAWRRAAIAAAFEADKAEVSLVGLFSLLPAVVDAVRIPVIAAGGIADARGLAAALILGASAVQIGTGFLRCPEAKLAPAWADAIANSAPEQTLITRAFSGRPGRSVATAYARAAARRAAAGALSRAARPDAGDARGRRKGQRHRPDAGLGRAIGRPRPRPTGGRRCKRIMGRRAGYSPLGASTSFSQVRREISRPAWPERGMTAQGR